MSRQFDLDRPFIERKYHDPEKPFNAYDRFSYHGWEPDLTTGLDDTAMLTELKKVADSCRELPHPLAKARGLQFVLEHAPLAVSEHDYFVYFYSGGRLLTQSFFNVWQRECYAHCPDAFAQMDALNRSGAVSMWPDYDHTIPGWDDLLSLGIPGIIERTLHYKAEKQKAGALTADVEGFYDGILVSYEAMLTLLDRYIAYIDSHPNAKSETVRVCLSHLRQGSPTDFYEALQLMYLYFIVCEHVDHYQVRSLGHGFDWSLERYYKRDLESGHCTEEQLAEYLAYFFMQFSAIGNYWGQPLYLGGTNQDGTTRYTDFSRFILKVYDDIGIYNPKIQLKINDNTPQDILDTALEMIRRKNASIVFSCEPGMIRSMSNYGVPYEEAFDYDISGCYETRVKDNETATGTGYINALKAVRYVFTRGVDERTGEQIGVDTGALETLTTFDRFYKAFVRQWKHLIDTVIRIANAYEGDLSTVNPANLFSGTSLKAVQRGLDGYAFAVDYNNSNLLNCGIGSAIDALMTVKEFVYEKQQVSLTKLADVLENNWEGHESLRLMMRAGKKKFGNGDADVRRYAGALSRLFTFYANNRPNARGGVFKSNLHSAMQYVWQGEKTGATPEGRKAGEEISKNSTGTPGLEREGVTAVMQDALALEPSLYSESACLDMMLHPSAVAGQDGLAAFRTLVLTFMRQGGQSLQFNICSADTLRDAQSHPEKYGDLQIRVCGWNVLWKNIPKAQQDVFIQRAESVRP